MLKNAIPVSERHVTPRIHDGLHARPAAQFVKRARRYGSEGWLSHNGRSVAAKGSVKPILFVVQEDKPRRTRALIEDCRIGIAHVGSLAWRHDRNPGGGLKDRGGYQQALSVWKISSPPGIHDIKSLNNEWMRCL